MVNSCHVNVSSLISHAVMLSGCWNFRTLSCDSVSHRENVIFHVSKIKTIKQRHFNVGDGLNNITLKYVNINSEIITSGGTW